jgi:hypothetical protein
VTNDRTIRGSTGPRVVLLDTIRETRISLEKKKTCSGGKESLKKLDKKNMRLL